MQPNPYIASTGAKSHAATDANEFLWKTYRWMSIGLAVTGFIAMMVANSPSMVETFILNRPLFWGLIIAEFGLVIAFSAMAHKVSAQAAIGMFLGYAALSGVTFSVIFLAYTSQSIATTFFVTAGSFGGLSIYGATTKRDLSPMRAFFSMALIGLIIAMVANMFIGSGPFGMVISLFGVLLFAGLTAYDTQKLLSLYRERGEAGNLAIQGALVLYLDFINLFLFLLRFLGDRRD